MILFACPGCRAELEADLAFAGETIVCPSCKGEAIVPASAIARGTMVAGYSIEKHLGGGGLGDVYEATQLSVGRRIALKILPPQFCRNVAVGSAFLHEARELAKFDQAGVVSVIDVGQEQDCLYLAMTLVKGEDLGRHLERTGRLALPDAVHIALHVARILDACEQRYKACHLDLKPSNIMVDEDGHVRLLDFGLMGHLLRPEPEFIPVRALILSPYMSPEQAQGTAEPGARADIYALGMVLFHLVTGHRPYAEHAAGDLSQRIMTQPLPSLRELLPEAPAALEECLALMTLKDPERRAADWKTVLEHLHRLVEKPAIRAPDSLRAKPAPKAAPKQVIRVRAPSTSASTAMRPPPKQESSPIAWVLIVLLLLGGAAIGAYLIRKHEARPANPPSIAPPRAPSDQNLKLQADAILNAAQQFVDSHPAEPEASRQQLADARAKIDALGLLIIYSDSLNTLGYQISQQAKQAQPARKRPEGDSAAAALRAAADRESAEPAPPAPEEPKPAAVAAVDTNMLLQAATALLAFEFGRASDLLATNQDPKTAALAAELKDYAAWEDTAREAFRDLVSPQENSYEFKRGTRTLIIMGVRPDGIRAERIEREGSKVTRRMAITFKPDDLTTDELLKRIGAKPDARRNIICGLLAYRDGKLSDARGWFNRSDSPWSQLLVHAMDAASAPTF